MSKETQIQWADHTFNPWIGCAKVSEGCANCYAEQSIFARINKIPWGKGKLRHRTSKRNWEQPLRWNAKAKADEVRRRVFPSLCDPFDEEVPLDWLRDFLHLIVVTQHLDWLLLTKRPQNILPRLNQIFINGYPLAYSSRLFKNIWLGVSAENQIRLDERIPVLLSVPASVHFVSVEPMLNHVALETYWEFEDGDLQTFPGIDWVIIGGESIGGRPCHLDWFRDVRDQCRVASVPLFIKQLGSNARYGVHDQLFFTNHPKGGDPDEWPEDLRIRQLPPPWKIFFPTGHSRG